MEPGGRVLVIPGLNGHPGLLMRSAPVLLPDWRAVAFSERLDLAGDGVAGLAERALGGLDGDRDEKVWVCGASWGGTVARTLLHLRPARVKGLILLSAFG